MKQSILNFAAIVFGIVFPYGYHWVDIIQYNLMIMLFFAFLGINLDRKLLARTHVFIFLVNLLLPLLLYAMLASWNQLYAMTAFVLAISPTAAAAPVLAQFFRTNIAYVTTTVLIGNPLIALAIPLLLPALVASSEDISVMNVLGPVLMVVGVPLLASLLVRQTSARLTQGLLRLRMISFGLFILNVWIGAGKATHFLLYESTQSWLILTGLGILTLTICLFQFKTGEWIGRKDDPLASGLALGRKNTMFGLWLALTFLEPTVALGPIFYILFQNLYNSYQLLQIEKVTRQNLL